jgi:hypothetical protein
MAKKNLKQATKPLGTETGRKPASADRKLEIQPAAGATVNKSPAPALAIAAPKLAESKTLSAPTSRSKVKTTFSLFDPQASQVSLSGEFNGWSPETNPMQRQKDGHWETTVELAPGRYEYKFILDGHWIPDPQATQNTYNQHGTLNSVIEVRG